MQFEDPVFASNTLNQHVVLSSDAKGSNFIEWHAAGDPSGNDVQMVDPAIARTAGFQRLLTRGILTVTEDMNDPTVVEAFASQRATWEARGAKASAAAQASIERVQDNDMLSIPCVGPDARGADGKCGTPVPVREKTKDQKPPLCPQHVAMAPQFIPYEEQAAPGQPDTVTVWKRMGTTQRATASV